MWKCRTVENEENQNQVSLVFHRPWKSLRDSHIPTTPTTILPFPNQNQKTRKEPQLRRKPQPPSSGLSFDEKMLGERRSCFQRLDKRLRQLDSRAALPHLKKPCNGSTKEIQIYLLLDTVRTPFPLALDDFGSVLAVKGLLRRFAPWTAPGRSEGMAVYEGERGGISGRACRAEREPFGHTSRLEP